jgi:hypothetical protein
MLNILLKYLGQYVLPEDKKTVDVKNKIKVDFDLLDKFNGYKQTQAFLKIKKTL